MTTTSAKKPRTQHGIDPIKRMQWDDFAFPFIVLFGLMILAAASHQLWPSEHPTAPWGYLLPLGWLAGFGALAYSTAQYTTPRGKVIHRHLLATLVAAGLMTTFLSVAGLPWLFWQSAAFWLCTFPGFFIALSWDMPRTHAVRGDGKDTHRQGIDLEAVGLHAGTILKQSKTIAGEIVVTHAAGEDTTVLQNALIKLESVAKLAAGTLTAQIGKHRGQSVLRAIDPGTLDRAVEWPGPSRPGGSVTEPIRTGVYADGSPHEFVLQNHGLTVGLTDAGKTFEAYYRITEMLTRRDVVVWWCDPVKGLQSAGPVLEGVDWAAQDEAEAKAMLKAILAMIPARTAELGRLKYTKWTPQCWTKHRIPKLYVQFEESAWLVESGALVKVAERARSGGIEFEMSQQRGSFDRLDTSVRAMLGRRTCFGVDSTTDAEFALSAETIDAGAVPHTWRDSKKGAFYREASTIPREKWAMAARSYVLPGKPDDPNEFDPTPLTQTIREWKHTRATLDQVSVQAAGAAYAKRQQTAAPRPVQPVNISTLPTQSGPGGDEHDDESALADLDFEPEWSDEDMDADLGLPSPDLSDLAGVNPLDDVPDGPDEVDLEDYETPKMPTEERNEKFRELLQAYLERGVTVVKQADLSAAWSEIPGAGGRPWPYMRLRALARHGMAARDEDDPSQWVLSREAGARTVTPSEEDE